ncbi:MAG: hypothetical protein ACT4P9_13435 [Betaproteobacteria bacterium]
MKSMHRMKMAAKTVGRAALVLGLGFAAGGCSLLSDYRAMDRAPIHNPEGHVVGQKEVLQYRGSGEELTRIALYTPWRNLDGQIVGYEEQTRSGSVIRDLKGNVIGSRWKDLRSRATNRNEGISVVFATQPSRQGAEAEHVAPVAVLDFVRLAGRL